MLASITLEIGELNDIVPEYMERCFQAEAYKKLRFIYTKLKIEVVDGDAECDKSGIVFNVIKLKGYCPKCNSFDKYALSRVDLSRKNFAFQYGFEKAEGRQPS